MTFARLFPLASVAALLVVGCKNDDPMMTASASGTTGSSTGSATDGNSSTSGVGTETGSGSGSGGVTASGTGTGTGTTDTSGCAFVDCQTTGEMMNECSVWLQDCPDGEKCMPWAKDGGNSWNAAKCSPVDGTPGQEGDKCTVEGSAVSGIDSCDVGLLCWFVDNMTLEGTCISMCKNEDSPTCPPDQLCDISNEGVLILCLHTCDPVVVDCPMGQICFPSSMGLFICDFDASGDMGAYGDPCEFINVCDPGLFCADPATVPDCQAGGCCSEFCDINMPNTCSGKDGGQECVPWYDMGMAPPGLEHVGGCAIPP